MASCSTGRVVLFLTHPHLCVTWKQMQQARVTNYLPRNRRYERKVHACWQETSASAPAKIPREKSANSTPLWYVTLKCFLQAFHPQRRGAIKVCKINTFSGPKKEKATGRAEVRRRRTQFSGGLIIKSRPSVALKLEHLRRLGWRSFQRRRGNRDIPIKERELCDMRPTATDGLRNSYLLVSLWSGAASRRLSMDSA